MKGEAWKKQAAYHRGMQAESLAATHLRQLGYEVLAERYRSPYGEVDILCYKDGMLIGVEVKARKAGEAAKYAISHRQQQRIAATISHYLAETGQQWGIRFDVITIDAAGRLEHLQDAWQVDVQTLGW